MEPILSLVLQFSPVSDPSSLNFPSATPAATPAATSAANPWESCLIRLLSSTRICHSHTKTQQCRTVSKETERLRQQNTQLHYLSRRHERQPLSPPQPLPPETTPHRFCRGQDREAQDHRPSPAVARAQSRPTTLPANPCASPRHKPLRAAETLHALGGNQSERLPRPSQRQACAATAAEGLQHLGGKSGDRTFLPLASARPFRAHRSHDAGRLQTTRRTPHPLQLPFGMSSSARHTCRRKGVASRCNESCRVQQSFSVGIGKIFSA